jgi:hypothetical protein
VKHVGTAALGCPGEPLLAFNSEALQLEKALLGAAAEVFDVTGVSRIYFFKPSNHLFELRAARQTGDTI